ncbi:MAG: spermidine/putrescine ABC transporter substrate-binding protein [Betaproteobacteria bacterium]|nr:spermidine/putrescine ABC transporter substrate-binding protein [Betaproteobacteria bacterium]
MRRRELLSALVAAFATAGVATFAGCGKTGSDAASDGDTPAPRSGSNELRLYNWNNYLAEETAKSFEAFCKCRLVQDYYSDNEEMLAKLAAGATGYDILVPSGNAVQTLINQGALRELDKSRIKGSDNLKPEFVGQWFDPDNQYSVPYAYSVTLLGYNAEKIQELGIPTDTWAAIFEPRYLEKLRGKVTVLDSQRELFAAALIYLDYSANETDEAKLREAREIILRAKPYWAAFNASSYIKELTIGNIWLAHGYTGDMFQAALDARNAKRPFSIGYATPKEGAVLGIDSMVLHKTGPRPDLAYLFINFMLDGKNAAQLSNMIGSGNPNAAAMPFIEPQVKENPAVFPSPERMRKLQQLRDLPKKERRLLNRFWTEVKVR